MFRGISNQQLCVLLSLCLGSNLVFSGDKRTERFLIIEDQLNANTSAPVFSDNTFPKILLCQVDKPCTITLPVDSKRTEIPTVQHGHHDPGLVVQPIKVWNKQPFICDSTHARCPYDATVTVTPTAVKTYQYCVQTIDENKVNGDERCFTIQGIQKNLMSHASSHYNYPPTLPNNATMSCPRNVTCHYTVDFQRHGGSCHRPRVIQPIDMSVQVTQTEVKQHACTYDVQYKPSVHAVGNKTVCVAISTSMSTVEKHCVNVDVTSKTAIELAGPCSRIYCARGSFCDSVDGKSRCLCQPGVTGKNCDKPVKCSVSFPSSITCPEKDCHVNGIAIGTEHVTSHGNIVDVKTSTNNGRVNVVQIQRTGNTSEICYHVNETDCHKEGCITVIQDNNHLPQKFLPGIFSSNNVTYNCSTDADCFVTVMTYPVTDTTCADVTVHPNTTVTNHRVFPASLTGSQCTSTIVLTGTIKPGVNQQLCLQTTSDVKCLNITVKDFEKCSPNPCKNGGACEALLVGYICTCSAGWRGSYCATNINECSPDPCRNGTCTDGINNYTCTCHAGYTGRICETDINECDPDPCQNGVCHDRINNYTCTCYYGYSGRTCSTDINECDPDPCLNGKCVDGINTYTCTCDAGYGGRNCGTNIDECSPDPCMNGTCIDGISNYTCTCDAGFNGHDCGTNINECDPYPCLNGKCVDGINNYTCTCDAGYGGRDCGTNIDECSPDPCINGTCIDGINNYTCTCDAGFNGHDCGTNINECYPDPCMNGTCKDGINNYTCTCDAGFNGRDCGTNIDECSPDPCINGTCVDGINGYSCSCDDGYNGRDCGTNINECDPDPCLNGKCVDGINNYTCTCDAGYGGRNCGTNINECSPDPCMNGTCKDGINNYTCTCDAGFNGHNCGTNIDECLSSPCQNGGTCWDGVDDYVCQCDLGYTGRNCNTDIDECMSDPCLNGAVCSDLVNSFKCSCRADFTGRFCETRVPRCHVGQCLNGGLCVNGTCQCQAGYRGEHCQIYLDPCSSFPCLRGSCFHHETDFFCDCPAGYTGKMCEVLINKCGTVPCLNGGTCMNSLNNFTCTCVPGFTGDRCQTDINDCYSMPCLHGGYCIDGINSFICQCQYGYGGDICQKVTDFCVRKPCVIGSCFSSATDFHCTCPPGYTGKTCNTTGMVLNGPDRVNITVPGGGDVLMNCDVTGQPTSYHWSKMNGCGGPHETAGGSKVQIHGATRGDAGIYTCTASNGHNLNVTKYFDVKVNTNQSEKCIFDRNIPCSWKQMNNSADDKFDWTSQSGSTQSGGTGPDNDHTTGNKDGSYLYIESSSPRLKGDYASLMSERLPANHTMCLEFWYYMYGDGIGNLTVNLEDSCFHKETEVFKRTGEQGQKWIKASVTIRSDLVPNDYTIKLTGDVGPTFKGDTAIDDLALRDGSCTSGSKSATVAIVG